MKQLFSNWLSLKLPCSVDIIFQTLYADYEETFWLDSNDNQENKALWSYMGVNSNSTGYMLRYNASTKTVTTSTHSSSKSITVISFFDYLNSLPTYSIQNTSPAPFQGGFIGWFGYEIQEETVCFSQQQSSLPDSLLFYVDRYIAIDHQKQLLYIICNATTPHCPLSIDWVTQTQEQILLLSKKSISVEDPEKQTNISPLEFNFSVAHNEYIAQINQCKNWIKHGESYQICLTNLLTCQSYVSSFLIYLTMRKLNPTAYSAYISCKEGRILCSSPECFLHISHDGTITTKPIKGTIHRSSHPKQDLFLLNSLKSCKKNQAENIMIVDLLRNDLAKLCIPGSVSVPKLLAIESFSTVHQLVSTVTGQLQPTKTCFDVLKATFPGGSITGAPKIRTMHLINKLEKRARGVYTGSIGWIGMNGTCNLNIVIRTIIEQQNQLSIGVGGGIVYQSNAQLEFEEIITKSIGSIQSIVTAHFGHFDDSFYTIYTPEKQIQTQKQL